MKNKLSTIQAELNFATPLRAILAEEEHDMVPDEYKLKLEHLDECTKGQIIVVSLEETIKLEGGKTMDFGDTTVNFLFTFDPSQFIGELTLQENKAIGISYRSTAEIKVGEQIDLICEGASFSIASNTSFDEFYTGADGYYGSALVYSNTRTKKPVAVYLSLGISADMISADELVARTLNVFTGIKDINDHKNVQFKTVH